MKKILGLDLGTNSIGWALIKEASNEGETSEIIKTGVRIIQYDNFNKTNSNGKVTESQNPVSDFILGKGLSPNAKRTQQRGARRNLQRYKQRRKNLKKILIRQGFITENTKLSEIGQNTTHQTISLRAKAAKEEVSLADFSRILLTINKKRGYKSNRKIKDEGQGQLVDGMSVTKELYDNGLTPGQYVLKLLNENRKYIPDFYLSDLQNEFLEIWNKQAEFYKDILSQKLFESLEGKNKTQTWAICKKPFGIEGYIQKGSAAEKRKERYKWRVEGITHRLNLEQLAIVLQDINNDINKSSGYLSAISDRSKELYFKSITVGQYLHKQLQLNPLSSQKNKVFYRQDYMDEFEQLWKTQKQFHPELNESLKKQISDRIIFFQRNLKSQKGTLSFCQFENWPQEYIDEKTGKKKSRTIGRRVTPKSSPLFQEFKLWQNLNLLEFTNDENKEIINIRELDDELRQLIFEELNLRGDLDPKDVLKILKDYINISKVSNWRSNLKKVEGNRTNAALYNAYQKIATYEGYGFDWKKKSASEIQEELRIIFKELEIDTRILKFDANKDKLDLDACYQLWHLLYATEEDDTITETDRLIYGNTSVILKKKLVEKFGFKPKHASFLANVSLQQDYGNLSAKAIKKILPHLVDGDKYSEAAAQAGYNHSNSLTAEEQAQRKLEPKLKLLKKNSLRNPMVEKILNQMVNVVNQIIDTYGKPDVIRIELARELKKSAKEREQMSKNIAEGTKRNDDIRKLIITEFGIPNPTRNDIIRYRLWQELGSRGYKDIFTDRYIPKDKIFSKDIDIEHIIPKTLLFDDSFSNKTITYKSINLKKDDRTALDFISQDYFPELETYKERVESLYKSGGINRSKRNKLLLSQNNLPSDFIERDLRNSQYIARKAQQMLEEVIREVEPTSGNVTDKLRKDWGLINMMKELNLPKYKALGLTEELIRWDNGQEKEKRVENIKDWSKRNDHRHHAMDALTVAFTTRRHIQYLNTLSARKDEKHNMYKIILGIERKITEKDERNKRRFISPMSNFRQHAKHHIENILISFKNRNKVVTKNVNRIKLKGKGNYMETVELTPRGQLHKESIYGLYKKPMVKLEKIGSKFDADTIGKVTKPVYRKALLKRLEENDNNPKKAFSGKNALAKKPIFLDETKTEQLPEKIKLAWLEDNFSIKKDVSPENFKNAKSIEKCLDKRVKQILLARLKAYGGDAKKAFGDIIKNPIWFNEEKGIAIKRVKISGVSKAVPLHNVKNQLGNVIIDKNNKTVDNDFVSTGNNHHVAIYIDNNGDLQEYVVSFYEAVLRAKDGLPVINKNYNSELGWEFQFTLKQNEMFLFPNADFYVNEIDLKDPENAAMISKHLFRVQKIATKNYMFRHHLETVVTNNLDFTYKHLRSTNLLKGVVKVRINHIGAIVQTGEY